MMKIDINRELELISNITGNWKNGKINEIQRDIVLEKLRKLYEQVKYGEITDIIVKEDVVENVPSVEEKQNKVDPQFNKEEQPAHMEQAATKIETPLQVNQTNDGGQVSETNQLFREEEIPVKHKLDRNVILSLYGENNEIVSSPTGINDINNNAVHPAQYNATPVTAPHINPGELSNNDTIGAENNKSILGEVMSPNEQTLSDAYAKQNGNTDVASVIGAGKITDLRHSIGINDKFLMIRDMFNGDSAAYEAAIVDLENYNDLDEVLLHIHETYNWNPNSEGVKLLMDLLTRKLS